MFRGYFFCVAASGQNQIFLPGAGCPVCFAACWSAVTCYFFGGFARICSVRPEKDRAACIVLLSIYGGIDG